jgi:hypothetical protein
VRELRAAFRRLRRSAGFAVPSVLTLAIGIGASAAVLTVVYGVLLKPLPYPDADRIVVIEHELPGFDMPGSRTAIVGGMYAQLADYLDRSTAFERLAATPRSTRRSPTPAAPISCTWRRRPRDSSARSGSSRLLDGCSETTIRRRSTARPARAS